MESYPYTKPRGVGPVTTQLTPGAESAPWKSVGAADPWSCSPTCRAWSESSRPSFTDSISTGAGCTCSPRNTGAGSTCSPCNNRRSTPSAFLHKQLDVTSNDPMAPVRHCELQSAQRQVSWQRRPKATSLPCETITFLVLIQARKEARDVDL